MGARDLDLDWARKQREGRNNKKSDRYNQKERKSTDRTTAVGRGWGAETEGQAIVAYSKLQCSCQWSGLARHSGGCWRGFTTTNLLALTFYLFKMTLWWYYPNDVLANIYSMPSRDEIQLKRLRSCEIQVPTQDFKCEQYLEMDTGMFSLLPLKYSSSQTVTIQPEYINFIITWITATVFALLKFSFAVKIDLYIHCNSN